MQKSAILALLFSAFFGSAAQSQTNWSLRTTLGIASENNLGDTGLRLSSKASRHFGKWSAFAQAGAFQMFQSNESWTGDEGYRNRRSLSTANFDLGAGFAVVNKSRVRLSADVAGSYRVGRQLWPELSVTINGHREDFYTFEKLSEIGLALGLDFSVRATDRLWIGLDAHCHSYNIFGEYLGIGLGATIRL